jgi:hypothetical protein
MDNEAKTIELWQCGYNAPCRVRHCLAKTNTIARNIDTGGRPMRQYERCQTHVGQVAESERAKGREIVNRGRVGR